MRLLQQASDGGFRLTRDLVDNIPPYAILSHTWGDDDEEVTFQDVQQHTGQHKAGYRKLTFCGAQAALDGLQYYWIDTCCIDKSSSAELTEAINSMFRWYQNAAQCYVDLADVSAGAGSGVEKPPGVSWTAAFRQSRWFSRGWTLQELLAPRSVTFFSVEGQRLGDKTSLEGPLQETTGISADALRGQPLPRFSVHERFSWMRSRTTKRPEDRAYSLLGIFDIYLPLIYGEGKENAFIRLRGEIQKRSQGTAGTILDKCNAHFIVPFGQNENFVGRESILRQLIGRLPPTVYPNTCQRTVVEGLGGIGKTQVAIEAAYRVRDTHPDCSVFWVPAVNMTMFENAYREIGQVVGVKGIDDDQADMKKLVKTALSCEDAGKWLLIIDNADDALLLTDGHLMSYLPFSRAGSILLTTRHHRVTADFEARQGVFRLHQLSDSESAQLLHQGLQPNQVGDPQSTTDLLKYLVHLPLAIRQATAYMVRQMGVTVAKYLEYCTSSDQKMIQMLNNRFGDQDRYKEIGNAVATTWLISFKQIQRDAPLATGYLRFIAYFAEKDIPVSLLPPGKDAMARDEAISILQAYAFITYQGTPDRFNVHRLVRLATHNWVQIQKKQSEQVTDILRHLLQEFPWPTHANRDLWSSYLPHTQAVLEFKNECTETNALLPLQDSVAEGNDLLGKYEEAEKMHRQTLELREMVLGLQHPDTLGNMNNLAETLRQQGKYEEAETMHRQILKLRETVLGRPHPDTLASMNNLAIVLRQQGSYEEAERVHRQTLELKETVLGRQHPDTLMSMMNIANALYGQGKYEEAQTMHRQTLQLKQTVLGRQHPDTLASMNNLALVLDSQGKYEEAEKVHRQTLELCETVLGRENPSTLTSMNNLALVLDSQGKCEEAEKVHRQTLELKEAVLGRQHPDTLVSIMNIANALYGQSKYEEAQTMHRQTLELKQAVLGRQHPSTLDSKNALANVLANQGKYAEAADLQSRALAGYSKVLGLEHPRTLASMTNLAILFNSQGKYEEAETMHRRTLPLRELALGREHPDTLKNMLLIAKVLKNQGKHAEAEQMHQLRLAWGNGGRLRKAEDERGEDAITSADSCAAPTGSQCNGQREPPDDQAEPESKRQCIR